MKRLEFLIRDIKSMSNIGGGSYSDELLTIYFNEAQSRIRNVIFEANNEANLLKERYYIQLIDGTREYDLPSRMFAVNSLLTAKASYENGGYFDDYTPLKMISFKEYGREFGYCILDKKFMFSINNYSSTVSKIELTYNRLLPELQKRAGVIKTIVGNVVTLDTGYDADISKKCDYVTSVADSGKIIKSDITLVSQVGANLTVSSSTDLAVGQFILVGEYSTTHSPLPIECENYLRKYVERRISIGDSSSIDEATTGYLTKDEEDQISSLFAKSTDDVMYPVIAPDSPWL